MLASACKSIAAGGGVSEPWRLKAMEASVKGGGRGPGRGRREASSMTPAATITKRGGVFLPGLEKPLLLLLPQR